MPGHDAGRDPRAGLIPERFLTGGLGFEGPGARYLGARGASGASGDGNMYRLGLPSCFGAGGSVRGMSRKRLHPPVGESMNGTESKTVASGRTQTMSMKILVVEDEEALAFGIRDALTHAGYDVSVAHEGNTALEMMKEQPFDLVVLDIMLPGKSGLEVLKELRQEKHDLRVVVLTALADESDVLRGFELGADDYMAKPFSPRELVARINAQFRRREMDTAPPPQLDLPGDIHVDLARLEVHRDGKVVQLTPREGDILEYLVRNHDRVVTREDLLLDVWHYRNANVETRTVDIHIVGLRRKVEPDPPPP
ncbi:MAG TPA: response regulator transcription factor, partial [Planctomycetes bacterium]|nr:response regulator transcription factor [Planctomycetota bacterium]